MAVEELIVLDSGDPDSEQATGAKLEVPSATHPSPKTKFEGLELFALF